MQIIFNCSAIKARMDEPELMNNIVSYLTVLDVYVIGKQTIVAMILDGFCDAYLWVNDNYDMKQDLLEVELLFRINLWENNLIYVKKGDGNEY
jgi:hypothetical protein